MRIPPGAGLLLLGSGIYWVLSGQLIASFTVLSPRLFDSIPDGLTLILIVGLISSATGLWIINQDLDQLASLLNQQDGWVYLIPFILVVSDLILTVAGLSSSQALELNPLVAAVVQTGTYVFAAFAVSYVALSEGLSLLMLDIGNRLFPSRGSRFLPFAATIGAAAFGPFSNLVTLLSPSLQEFAFLGGASGGILVAVLVLGHFKGLPLDQVPTLSGTRL